ncbi:PREDICTED: ankyrin repeat-containing protein At3g12360-like [Prunus mume]|uniref:Ankyrin repeat-containing protein At3g12360-like n=1 Tax=Prunus mume TaxID=102107 RepID=A0ABM1LNN9_PRUMU|nr:PREDICTED: ankyrin repeat-containing protein At3g12360-like [Prunus mume]
MRTTALRAFACAAYVRCAAHLSHMRWHNNNDESDVKYDSLYHSLKRGDWNAAKEFIDRHPEALKHRGSSSGGTTLHEAIERKQLHIVEELLKLMTEEDLEIQDDIGSTAFFYTLQKGMASIVTSMQGAAHLNHIQGAALPMQRELQWFKEVESIVSPQCLEVTNVSEKMTAREVFTKNHKELVKEGEESMKGTTTSCTVVGALIVTIMFAASFTVPGGNNQDTVMIFLGILTSRYAEDDFLSVPIASFVWMQFPLFLDIFMFTYGKGIFDKKCRAWE